MQCFSDLGRKLKTLIHQVWLAGSAACDLIITVSLVVLLHKRKPASHGLASGFLSTTDLVNKLIRFNMETGMITSLGAITELALFLSTHQYNFHLILFLMLGKLCVTWMYGHKG